MLESELRKIAIDTYDQSMLHTSSINARDVHVSSVRDFDLRFKLLIWMELPWLLVFRWVTLLDVLHREDGFDSRFVYVRRWPIWPILDDSMENRFHVLLATRAQVGQLVYRVSSSRVEVNSKLVEPGVDFIDRRSHVRLGAPAPALAAHRPDTRRGDLHVRASSVSAADPLL